MSIGTVVHHRRYGYGQVIARAANLGDVVVRFARMEVTTSPAYLNIVRSFG